MHVSRLRRALALGVWLLTVTLIAYVLGHALAGFALAAASALLWMLFSMHPQPAIRPAVVSPAPRAHADFRRIRRLAVQFRALRNAVATLPDAVVLLDRECRALWFNRAAGTLLGLQRPEHLHGDVCALLADSRIGQWLREGVPEPPDDAVSPLDPNVHLDVSLIPVGNTQRLLLARDISPLVRTEKMRRDFVANVSHELRTPLTVIHGYLELLDPEDVPQLANVLTDMRGQSKRMAQIVEDLLTLSRLETQSGFSEEHVVMAPLLATLRREAEALSQGRHSVKLEMHDGPDLFGSLKDLHSAFSNLISNAVRYTPSGGSIRILWRARADGGAEFAVEDTGYGIPAHHIERLTERFYRVSSSRSRELGGTGLGLSIVKHALGMHQAHIEVHSEPGRGSTFTAVFPAARVRAVTTPA